MDKIKLLQSRREQVLAAGTEIRKTISSLIDENSFVELSGFSFSKNEFFDAEAEGEGVVTGFATIDGYPVYIAAQNAGRIPNLSFKTDIGSIFRHVISR